jgi:ATP-dependent Clp protease ATP-binding subunit ClpX
MKKNEDKRAVGHQRDTFCSFCRKSYRQVGPLIEGPGDVYICGERVELCQSIIEQEKRRRGVATPLPTLESVGQRIHWLVGGQSELTKVLASVHAHYASPAHSETEHDPRKSIRGHILLVGPTRSSKILLSSALAHTFDVPFASGDAAE